MWKRLPTVFFLGALAFAGSMYAYSELIVAPEAGFRMAIVDIPEDRDIPKDIYAKYYDTLGPERLLSIISERPSCHMEGHNLGRMIYERTNDLPAAANLCTNKCWDGCMHGAMLGFVESERAQSGLTGDPRPEDLTPSLMKKIAGLCDGVVTQYTHYGSCFHALGHIFAEFTESDVPQTLQLCRSLKSDGAVFSCVAGFYMQRDADYAQADIAAQSSKLYPCDRSDYPAACYRYRIPRLYPSASTSPQALVQACDALKEPDRSACFNASGIMFSDLVYVHPTVVNDVCNTDDPVARRMCLDGVLGRQTALGHFDIGKICSAYAAIPKAQCMQSTTSIFSIYQNFTTYLVRR